MLNGNGNKVRIAFQYFLAGKDQLRFGNIRDWGKTFRLRKVKQREQVKVKQKNPCNNNIWSYNEESQYLKKWRRLWSLYADWEIKKKQILEYRYIGRKIKGNYNNEELTRLQPSENQ